MSNIKRPPDCRMRSANGNCCPMGGFCTSNSMELCEAMQNAYENGRNDIIIEILQKNSCVGCTLKEGQRTNKEKIANIIYNELSYMYCDNCRYKYEIGRDEEEWHCDDCHRKYNAWGISMAEAERIAEKIRGEENSYVLQCL